MKHTPLRRGAALLLCLTMLMGLLPGLLTRAHAAPSEDYGAIYTFVCTPGEDEDDPPNAPEMGTVTVQLPNGSPETELENVPEGTVLELKAAPNPGYLFQKWFARCYDGVDYDEFFAEVTDATAKNSS